MKAKFENLENSEMKLTLSLTETEFEKYHELGFKKVQEVVQVDGFRKGNVPENLIVQKYGEMIILEEMANFAINETYLQAIIKENDSKKDSEKITPISNPKVTVTKIGKGSEFEYVATFAVLPKFDLVDYKKLSKEESKNLLKEELEELKKKNEIVKDEDIFTVTDAEVNAVIEDLQKARTPHTHIHEDGSVHHNPHDGNAEIVETENIGEEIKKEEELPELNDEFAQSFGEQFKTLDDLKNKIKENLTLEKKQKFTEKKRTKILERLVNETTIIIPEILVEDELEKMKAQMKMDVERFGGKWEDYLVHVKKTEEDLKKEWRDIAEKRTKSQLIVNEIAKHEKIEVTENEIDAEAIKILAQAPDAKEEHVKPYVKQVLQNEKVMKILEGEE